MTATISETVSVGGLTLTETTQVTAENAVIKDVLVPAGKAGTLTTRTNNTDGSVTTTAGGHGIVNAQVVDLYWVGGSRRNVVVGTVAGSVIPFTGGVGDNLPVATTAITISARVSVAVALVGADVAMLACQVPASVRGTFSLRETGNAYPVNQTQLGVWHWTANNGVANPLTGYTTNNLFLSHDSTSAQRMQFTALGAS